MDHDQNFKNLIVDYPHDAISLFAASVSADVDPDARITPIRQEQLKERLGDRFRELDVPLLVEWPDGRREAILFVIEEETEPSRFSIHRLAHYCLDLAAGFDTERVVPVVVFLNRGPFRRDLRLGSDSQDHLQFNFLSFSLAEEPAERHLDSPNVVARLNLPNMAYRPEAKVDIYEQAVRGLVMLEPDHGRRAKYTDFIDMYAALDENEWAIDLARAAKEDDVAVSFRQKMEEEGLKKGLEQGREEGAHDGAARMLLRQLGLRFGDEASASVRSRVEAAELDEIMAWSDRILTAASLEDVFR
ncbi:MAG: hypothetical protein JJT88_20250 [Gammaproteobacteria bacterium]|nr:hypothetical protein [Gammaproteobacteria bacterium]